MSLHGQVDGCRAYKLHHFRITMKELFKLSAGALLVATILFSSSCKHEPWIPDGYLPSPDDTTTTSATCDPDTSYFVNDVMPIFASSCAMSGCHDDITSEGGIRLTDYQSIISTGEIEPSDPNESKVWKAITESDPQDRMPPLSSGITLTQEQRDAIFDWISQGALNNACTENNCDTIDVSYASNVRPIFELHCLGCHTGAAVAGANVGAGASVAADAAAGGAAVGTGAEHAAITNANSTQTPILVGIAFDFISVLLAKKLAYDLT